MRPLAMPSGDIPRRGLTAGFARHSYFEETGAVSFAVGPDVFAYAVLAFAIVIAYWLSRERRP